MFPFAGLSNQVPVDGIHVAKRWILLETNGAPHDSGQTMQPNLLQVHHLERDQGVVDEQRMAPNHAQIGEQATDASQPFHPIIYA